MMIHSRQAKKGTLNENTQRLCSLDKGLFRNRHTVKVEERQTNLNGTHLSKAREDPYSVDLKFQGHTNKTIQQRKLPHGVLNEFPTSLYPEPGASLSLDSKTSLSIFQQKNKSTIFFHILCLVSVNNQIRWAEAVSVFTVIYMFKIQH